MCKPEESCEILCLNAYKTMYRCTTCYTCDQHFLKICDGDAPATRVKIPLREGESQHPEPVGRLAPADQEVCSRRPPAEL